MTLIEFVGLVACSVWMLMIVGGLAALIVGMRELPDDRD